MIEFFFFLNSITCRNTLPAYNVYPAISNDTADRVASRDNALRDEMDYLFKDKHRCTVTITTTDTTERVYVVVRIIAKFFFFF